MKKTYLKPEVRETVVVVNTSIMAGSFTTGTGQEGGTGSADARENRNDWGNNMWNNSNN